MSTRNRGVVRPLLDLDLGHAHQYGYRRPERIPTRRVEEWPTPLTDPTRTAEKRAAA